MFDLNDFDETLPGPWEWDVKRLAVSMVVAGRDNELHREAAGKGRRRDGGRLPAGDAAVRRDAEPRPSGTRASTSSPRSPACAASSPRSRCGSTEQNLAKARTKDSMHAFTKLTEMVDGEPRIISDPPLIVRVEDLFPEATAQQMLEMVHEFIRGYRRTLQTDRRTLLEQFRFVDLARKVVGVGSVGTRAWIGLFLGKDGQDPLFLQVKEAQPSVLEEFVGKSGYSSHGERVVAGQHLMQASSDIFLGWRTMSNPVEKIDRDFYVRQLKDWKGSAELDGMTPEAMGVYGRLCGWTLARAHARSGDRIAIASYLGREATPSTAPSASSRRHTPIRTSATMRRSRRRQRRARSRCSPGFRSALGGCRPRSSGGECSHDVAEDAHSRPRGGGGGGGSPAGHLAGCEPRRPSAGRRPPYAAAGGHASTDGRLGGVRTQRRRVGVLRRHARSVGDRAGRAGSRPDHPQHDHVLPDLVADEARPRSLGGRASRPGARHASGRRRHVPAALIRRLVDRAPAGGLGAPGQLDRSHPIGRGQRPAGGGLHRNARRGQTAPPGHPHAAAGHRPGVVGVPGRDAPAAVPGAGHRQQARRRGAVHRRHRRPRARAGTADAASLLQLVLLLRYAGELVSRRKPCRLRRVQRRRSARRVAKRRFRGSVGRGVPGQDHCMAAVDDQRQVVAHRRLDRVRPGQRRSLPPRPLHHSPERLEYPRDRHPCSQRRLVLRSVVARRALPDLRARPQRPAPGALRRQHRPPAGRAG